MDLSVVALAGSYFAQFVLLVVVITILAKEFSKRRFGKKGILPYILLYFIVLLMNIFESSYIFGMFSSDSASIITSLILALAILVFSVNSARIYRYIDRRLFFGILFVGVWMVFFRNLLPIITGKSYFILYSSLFLGVVILNYFFTMRFLINTLDSRLPKKTNGGIKKMVGFFVLFTVFAFLLLVSLSEINSSSKMTDELKIYNWNDYLGGDDVIKNFEDEFGVNVVLNTFDDEYDMYYELSGNPGEFDYDIVVVSDDLLGEMVEGDYLSEIRKKNVPNIEYVDNKCIIKKFENYAVPYFWGTTGLAFNMNYLPEDTNSWSVLWNEDYEGKISVLDNPGEVIAMTSRYIGGSIVPSSKSQFDEIEKFLFAQKPLIRGYESEEFIIDGLVSEDIWAAQIYDVAVRYVQKENENIRYVLPMEGGVQWVDNFVIMKNSKNRRTAEEFINYIYRPEVAKDIIEYQVGYGCNAEAMRNIDEGQFFYFSEKDLKFFEYFSDYERNKDTEEFKRLLWEELIK